MKQGYVTLAITLAALGCEGRSARAVPDASVEHVSIEPLSSDASTTSAMIPIAEAIKSPPREEAPTQAAADGGADAGLPRWVPKNATFSVIESSDRDRNLGIAPPPASASPQRLTVDAGGVAVDIEVHPRP